MTDDEIVVDAVGELYSARTLNIFPDYSVFPDGEGSIGLQIELAGRQCQDAVPTDDWVGNFIEVEINR